MNIVRNGSVNITDLVSVEVVRGHIRALDSSEDALIESYLESAVDYLQQQSGFILGESTVTVILNRDELESVVRLSGINNITSVDAVQYLDTATSYQTLESSRYRLFTDYPGTFELTETVPDDMENQSDESLVKITLTAGADLTTVKKQYRQAALLLVGHWYYNREASSTGAVNTEIAQGVDRLMASARQF